MKRILGIFKMEKGQFDSVTTADGTKYQRVDIKLVNDEHFKLDSAEYVTVMIEKEEYKYRGIINRKYFLSVDFMEAFSKNQLFINLKSVTTVGDYEVFNDFYDYKTGVKFILGNPTMSETASVTGVRDEQLKSFKNLVPGGYMIRLNDLKQIARGDNFRYFRAVAGRGCHIPIFVTTKLPALTEMVNDDGFIIVKADKFMLGGNECLVVNGFITSEGICGYVPEPVKLSRVPKMMKQEYIADKFYSDDISQMRLII